MHICCQPKWVDGHKSARAIFPGQKVPMPLLAPHFIASSQNSPFQLFKQHPSSSCAIPHAIVPPQCGRTSMCVCGARPSIVTHPFIPRGSLLFYSSSSSYNCAQSACVRPAQIVKPNNPKIIDWPQCSTQQTAGEQMSTLHTASSSLAHRRANDDGHPWRGAGHQLCPLCPF